MKDQIEKRSSQLITKGKLATVKSVMPALKRTRLTASAWRNQILVYQLCVDEGNGTP